MSERSAAETPGSTAVLLYAASMVLIVTGIVEALTLGLVYAVPTFSGGLVLFLATGWLLLGSRAGHTVALVVALACAFFGLSTADSFSAPAGLAIIGAALIALFAISRPSALRSTWRRAPPPDVDTEPIAT